VGSDGCFAGHDLAFAKKESGTQQDVSSSFMMSGIPPTAAYLIGVPSIMLGSILFVGGILGLIIGHDDESRTGKAAPRKKSSVRVMPGFRRPWR
jgi:hypothetical protein